MKAVSCNGCRILRKGCPQDCPIRQCLLGFDSSDSQANATLFLAKFYGRAALCNLIKACHESQRHSLFRSLLYESCGRILNPVYGSLGLLYSGDWLQCVAAVRSVLQGSFTADENTNGTESIQIPLAGCDIRHVSNKSILPMKMYRKASNTMRPKRAALEVGGDVSTGTSTEDEARPTMANKRKLNDLFEEEEIEEQESKRHRPSTLNLNLASPANQEKLDDQWDDDINLKLSLRRNCRSFWRDFRLL